MKIDVGSTDIHLPQNKLKLPTQSKSILLRINYNERKRKYPGKLQNNILSIYIISQKVSCVSKFEKHCDKLFQFKHISGTIAYNAKLEFDAFLSSNVLSPLKLCFETQG